MEWYFWVLIAIALAALILAKMHFVPKWLKGRQEKRKEREKLMEDDE